MATATLTRGDWLTRAACRQWPAEMWDLVHNGLTDDNITAQSVCRTCPVTLDCAAHTDSGDEGVIRAGFAIRFRSEAVAIAAAARRELSTPTPAVDDTSDLRPCGTYAAYRRHLRRRERPCAACRKAGTVYAYDHSGQTKARAAS